MRIRKRWSVFMLALLLCCSVGVTVYAHDVPDHTEKGSVSVTMTYDGNTVSGGTLTLYRVGAVEEDDGNYRFVLTGDFTGCGEALDALENSQLPARLAKYASSNSISGTTADIGTDGTAVFPNLELGLYLVVQNKAADGYETAAPFVVSVPVYENGAYLYDVDAAPKLSTLKKTEFTPGESTPTAVPTVTPPSTGSVLPQTGQLNWPVPVLTALGLCLFLAGWALRFGKKDVTYEA